MNAFCHSALELLYMLTMPLTYSGISAGAGGSNVGKLCSAAISASTSAALTPVYVKIKTANSAANSSTFLKAVFQLRVFHTYVHARKSLNQFQYYI